MKVQRLRYFLALSEQRHFGRAAQKLHITQPTMSQQIMMLEKELGVQLFFRNNRNISLTEAGRSLERNAKRIMSLVEFARGDLNEAAQGEHGILSLGYVGFAMDGVLPAIIDRFRKRYLKVELKLQQMTSSLQLTEIRHGTIHAGIFRLSDQDISDLNVKPVQQDDYFLAVPSGHHLSKAKEVSIRDLSGESMILLDRHLHPGLTNELHRIFCQEECVLNIV